MDLRKQFLPQVFIITRHELIYQIKDSDNISIDNIKIYTDGQVTPPKLYKVATYTTTDTWTDISPDTDYTPLTPYGLAVDTIDTNNLEVMATDGSTPKYFQSGNTGTSYTDNGASDYRNAKRIGDAIIYGGVSVLDLSRDAGSIVIDKLGNLDVVFNPVETVKNILLLG